MVAQALSFDFLKFWNLELFFLTYSKCSLPRNSNKGFILPKCSMYDFHMVSVMTVGDFFFYFPRHWFFKFIVDNLTKTQSFSMI